MRTLPALAFVAALALPRSVPAQEGGTEMTERTRTAIDKALVFMAKCQARNGSYEGSAPVATAALCGLAFLASGSTYDRGPYAENLRRTVTFLMRSTGRTGFITEGHSGVMGSSAMHGHGYGALFLAEVSGTVTDPEIVEELKEKLRAAVKCIEGCQNQYGGWNSSPDRNATDDGSGAVAVMQILALRAARNAGVEVSPTTVEKAVKYILKITNDQGWTAYNIHSMGHQSSALTGAGMSILNALGLQDSPKLKKGIANLMKSAPFLKGGADGGWSSWYYYTAFHASLAIFQQGGSDWEKWWPGMRDDLLKRQSGNGGWEGAYGGYGPLWSAFATLTLELPFRYLPLFAEGGRGSEGK